MSALRFGVAVAIAVIGMVVVSRFMRTESKEVIQGTAWILLQEKAGDWWNCDLGFADRPPIHFKSKDKIHNPIRGRIVRVEMVQESKKLLAISDLGAGELEDVKTKAPWWSEEID